jgi:DNA-binding MarR family transcriptional regulator
MTEKQKTLSNKIVTTTINKKSDLSISSMMGTSLGKTLQYFYKDFINEGYGLSIAELLEKQNFSRVTIMENVHRLRKKGFLEDLGYSGSTNRRIRYRLNKQGRMFIESYYKMRLAEEI